MTTFAVGHPVETTAPAVAVDGLALGKHVFTLVVEDEDGNRSAPASATVTVIRLIPVPKPPTPVPVGARKRAKRAASKGRSARSG